MSCNNNKVFLNFTLFSVQAFSKVEVTAAKQLKEQLESFQERTDAAWKEMRWIEDAVQKGRYQATVSSASSLLPVKVLRDVTRINLPGGLRGSKFYPSPLSLSLPPFTHAHCYPSGPTPEPNSGYLRVFPAYTTGLVSGTSVRVSLSKSEHIWRAHAQHAFQHIVHVVLSYISAHCTCSISAFQHIVHVVYNIVSKRHSSRSP